VVRATATDIATELFAVRSEIAALKLRENDLEGRLAAEMEDNVFEVPSIGVFQRRRKTDRKAWDHEGIYSALLRRLRDLGPGKVTDDETGEIIELDPMEGAFRTLKEGANPSWRVTALRQRGLDPDEFCETTYGGFSIQFVGELDGGS
jgi:hypothetical protein